MIAIIAEKPSVAQDIARVIGATQKKEGYMSGNGYMVTWALGHLISLALPGAYGYSKITPADLPVMPDPFQLVIRQHRTDKGMVTDIAAARQLKVIDYVFSKCENIIVATDAGREGELIFRYIYSYLGYTKPFQRLWISSLTDEAIRQGMADLKEGRDYDCLYKAADCRAKADWLVGINASQALTLASGTGNNSLGRVQTPTLAMICSRFLENRDFVSSQYWQLHITLCREDKYRQFRYIEDLKEKEEAETVFARMTPESRAVITKIERQRGFQAPPLLYDLTTLQKDCNIHFDLTAEKTLAIAQSLYERKLISYPRTGSRYIPDDVMRQIPELLHKITQMRRFKEYGSSFDLSTLSRRSVNTAKVTDHHALLITGERPLDLDEKQTIVYQMIAGRMLEAFSPRCEKETVYMEAVIDDMKFQSRTSSVIVPGWRAVFARSEDREEDEPSFEDGTAEFEETEVVPVAGYNLVQKKTMPKPLFTEATLLTAMETAGKNLPDEEAREAIKDIGIGTPATRAAILTTLLKRGYIERSGKALVPTERGLIIYDAVKNMRVADVELTGSWEKTLGQIEQHKLMPETFMQAIGVYARQVTEEVLSIKFPEAAGGGIICPKCGQGKIMVRPKVAKCNNEKCGLIVFRRILNKELTEQHLQQLFASGTTRLIKGFKGKQDNTFDAMLSFDKNYNLTFKFPKLPGKSKRKGHDSRPVQKKNKKV